MATSTELKVTDSSGRMADISTESEISINAYCNHFTAVVVNHLPCTVRHRYVPNQMVLATMALHKTGSLLSSGYTIYGIYTCHYSRVIIYLSLFMLNYICVIIYGSLFM